MGMALLSAADLTQSFGATDLFTAVSLEVHQNDRIGLVGPNGCGKTTLLRILAKMMEPTAGTISHATGLTVGYLRQEAVLTFAGRDNTIYEEMLTVFANLQAMERDLRALEQRMSAGEMAEDVLEAYGRIQDTYELQGGYQYQNEIKHVLMGLGFTQNDWNKPLAQLSGGQKTRVLLGRLLLEKPMLLILDEPTNHLDITAVEWLEATLQRWQGALLIVSHDRYFLDRVVNQIWDLTPTGIQHYKGNYTNYITQRQMAWEHELALFTAEKARLEKELTFIQKHIAGGKTDIAKGKLKRLTRDILLLEEQGATALQNKNWLQVGSRTRTFSANEAAQHIRALAPPNNRPPRLNFRLQSQERSARYVLKSKKLTIGYPGAPLFTTDKLNLERQECAALIGPNGSGKTTFLRTILGKIRPLSGSLKNGPGTKIGYFAQAHDQLNMQNTILDELLSHNPTLTEQEARSYLAQYLFKGNDPFKPIHTLSGGERGRLALALLALDGANFLLLDEPTNHLDIPSQEVVQEVLEKFNGTILMVSHDRYLVDHLATQIWELKDNHLTVHQGTYKELLQSRSANEPEENTAKIIFVNTPDTPPEPIDLSWVNHIAPAPILDKRTKRELQHRLQELKDLIEESEAWLEQLQYEQKEAQTNGSEPEIRAIQSEIATAETELQQLNNELDEIVAILHP
ncbi:MAG: ABC-F family ATP-binding cassette domain-containing protein [Candidatus Promineifilaceae bacterium]